MSLGPMMVGLSGLSLEAAEREFLHHPALGGIILFGRNYEDPEQLQSLVRDIRRLRSELLLAVDHEGGRVQRFRTSFTRLPAMRHLALDANPSASTHQIGWLLGSELRACGLDFSFTPVLDLDYGLNEVIGDRAFGSETQPVIELAGALIEGLNAAGMCAIGKHFPGHGGVEHDTHLSIARDERPLDILHRNDLRPFAALCARLGGIMPAHVSYPQVDDLPAGFSHRWLQQILRQELGFNGAIISDDLDMAAATALGRPAHCALLALEAGCDLILACNNQDAAMDALDAVLPHPALRDPARMARLEALRAHLPMPQWVALHQNPMWQQAHDTARRLCSVGGACL